MELSIKKIVSKISESYQIPYGLVLNVLIAKLGTVYSHYRPRIKLPNENPHIVNVYSFGLAPSGIGKNKAIALLDDFLFKKINEEIEKDFEVIYKNKMAEVEEEAKQLATRKTKEGKNWIDNNTKDKFIEQNAPRKLEQVISDLTVEGLQSDRYEASQSFCGSFLFQNTEFLDYIVMQNKEKSYVLSYLADIFDKGNDLAKSTKSEKQSKKTSKGIPQNLAVYASVDVMHDDNSYKLIMNKIGSAFARRAFIYFDNKFEQKILSLKERREMSKLTASLDLDITDKMLLNFKKLMPKIAKKKCEYKIFELKEPSEAEELWYIYQEKCESKAVKQKNYHLINDLRGRPWRTVKLATILQIFYNCDSEIIEKQAMEEAIEICDYFGECFFNFVNDVPKSDWQKIFDFFKENVSRQVSMTELSEKRFFSKNNFKRDFEEFVPYAEHKAAEEGFVFEKVKGSKNSKFYVLKTLEEKMEGK